MSALAPDVETPPPVAPGEPVRRAGRLGAFRSLPADRKAGWFAGSVAVGVLVFLVGPLLAVLGERQPTIDEMLVFAALAGFAGLYLWAIPSDLAGRTVARPERAAVVLALLAVAIALAQPRIDWTVLFIATGAAAGRIAGSRSAGAATLAIAALAVLVLVAADAVPIDALESGFEVVLAGMLVFIFSQLEHSVGDLRRARAQGERLAVSEERLRIARDMHDLLGHSLSVIALKVELARRLVERDPGRATQELREVEAVTRDSLRDVRVAVAGYRRITLDTELAAARMALSAAGVVVDIHPPDRELDEETDRLLGWIVREGVTNMVRHSGATHCAIDAATTEGGLRLEITDDGHGSADAPGGLGSGLRGIRERVEAVGGHMQAGPAEGRGFRLAAFVPLAANGPLVANGPGRADGFDTQASPEDGGNGDPLATPAARNPGGPR